MAAKKQSIKRRMSDADICNKATKRLMKQFDAFDHPNKLPHASPSVSARPSKHGSSSVNVHPTLLPLTMPSVTGHSTEQAPSIDADCWAVQALPTNNNNEAPCEYAPSFDDQGELQSTHDASPPSSTDVTGRFDSDMACDAVCAALITAADALFSQHPRNSKTAAELNQDFAPGKISMPIVYKKMSFPLGDKFVSTSIYHGKKYVHLREWDGGLATKKGITLTPGRFASLMYKRDAINIVFDRLHAGEESIDWKEHVGVEYTFASSADLRQLTFASLETIRQ